MAAVKWDTIKEFVQQNGYVKQICDPLGRVARTLEALVRRAPSCCVRCAFCLAAHALSGRRELLVELVHLLFPVFSVQQITWFARLRSRSLAIALFL